jgi:hypothetical protein
VGLHDDWLDIYDSAVDDGADLAALPCPNCSHKDVRLVFVCYDDGYDPHRGTVALWCEHCLTGVTMGRMEIVEGFPRVLSEQSRRADGGPIPNFELVPPE